METDTSADDPPNVEEREQLIEAVMMRKGVSRAEAEAALARAEAEVLRMRDA